jgi:hypothetical protein
VACTATVGTLFATLDSDVYNENVITIDVADGIQETDSSSTFEIIIPIATV